MSSPPRTLPDPAGPPSPSRDKEMPQQSTLSHTPVKAAKSPEPKKSRQAVAAPATGDATDTPVDEDLIDTLMNKRGAPATMTKLNDSNGNQVAVFQPLGAMAVEQMNANTTQSGDRGRKFVLNNKLQTYVWLETVDASSNVDSRCVKYALKYDRHARRVVVKYGRVVFASFREELRPKVFVALLVGRGQTCAGGASLAIARALTEEMEGVEVLPKLLYRDVAVDVKTPYEDRARREHQLARLPNVNLDELAKCRDATLLVLDMRCKSGGKGAAARRVLAPAIQGMPNANIDLKFAALWRSVPARRTSFYKGLVADLRTAMANAVELELQNDGPSLETSGAMGALIYLVDGPDGVRIVYGGSHKASEGAWTDSGQELMAAVEDDEAAEAVELADELVVQRAYGHDTEGRHGNLPNRFQGMYAECEKAKNDYRVRDFIRALAFIWSFPGETEAAFIQRLLLLEQDLLDVLFRFARSAQRCECTRGRTSTRARMTRSPARR